MQIKNMLRKAGQFFLSKFRYLHIYPKTNTDLLENVIDLYLKTYQLDTAHYITARCYLQIYMSLLKIWWILKKSFQRMEACEKFPTYIFMLVIAYILQLICCAVLAKKIFVKKLHISNFLLFNKLLSICTVYLFH